MLVSGSMTNPSINQEPIVANSTQVLASVSRSTSPITTKAEDRSTEANRNTDSSSQQNRKQNNMNAGVEAALREYFADIPLMVEISRCESNFRQFDANGDVLRGFQVSDDIGVMQVNTRYHGKRAEKLQYNLYTLSGNMGYARLLHSEQGYWPWLASYPCWGKSGLAANFKIQVENRNIARAEKAALAQANATQAMAATKATAEATLNTASVPTAVGTSIGSVQVVAER